MSFNWYVMILMVILLLLTSCQPDAVSVAPKPTSLPSTPLPLPSLEVTRIYAPTPTQAIEPTATRQPEEIQQPSIQPGATVEPTPSPPPRKEPGEETAHPYLLFTQPDLAEFRADIDQPGNFRRELFTALAEYLRQAESSSMLASAFFYLLTDDSNQWSQATTMLLEEVAQNCWDSDGQYCLRDRVAANQLGQVSMAYDWLYRQLSPEERDQVKNRIAVEICRLYEAATYGENNTAEGWGNWWRTAYTQNHFHSVIGGMVLGALAIKFDDPPSCSATDKNGRQTSVTNDQILAFGLEKMERNYLIFNRITDGSYPEGDSYVTAYGQTYLTALWATHHLLALDLVKEKRLARFPLFYLFNAPPGQLWNQLTNYGDYYTSSRENYWFPKDLHLAATLQQNQIAAWLAQQFYYDLAGQVKLPADNDVAANNFVLDFVFLDPKLAPLSPAEANLDLSYHAQDWEGVFMRSNWSDTAVAAALKVGPPGGHTAYNIARSNYQGDQWVGHGQEPTEFNLVAHHMHPDANGIYLYTNKTFLLPEMPGYLDEKPWGRYTSSHNTILVSDDWGRMRGQIQGDTMGGTTFGHRLWEQGNDHFWDIETPDSEVGIIQHAATQGFDYSLGQATGAYWPELGLKRFHRHVLFVRDPGYMWVVDDLDATSPKTYDWVGHSTGTVTRQENWLKVEADNEQQLGIAVLSPSSFTLVGPMNEWEGIKLEDIYSFRYISANRTIYEWQIRQNCQTCRFVTFLFPTNETRWAQKPVVTQLSDTDQLVASQVNFGEDERIDTLAISLIPGQRETIANLTFDGHTVAVEKVGPTRQRALLVHGSTLKDGETTLIQHLPTTSFLEVQYNGNKLSLRSPDLSGVTLFAPGVTTVSWQRVTADNKVVTQNITFSRDGDYITLP